MAISIVRRRGSELDKVPKDGGLYNILLRRSLPIPPLLLLLMLIFVWCSSTLVSVSFFHVCISSRKLDLYCVSAGTRPEFSEIALRSNNHNNNNNQNSNGGDNNTNDAAIAITDNNTNTKTNNNKSSEDNNDNSGGDNSTNDAATAITDNNTNNDNNNSSKDNNDNSGGDNNSNGNNNNSGNSDESGYTTTNITNTAAAITNNNNDDNKNNNENGKTRDIDFEEVVMNNHNNKNISDARKAELANAIKVVEEQMRALRSSSRLERIRTLSNQTTTCDGRGIFVYDLPPKFNRDLVNQCGDMLPWMNFCKYLTNDAMGEPIPELGNGWYQTHQYSLEPIFHSRVLKHPCRVYNASDAKLFYVPFYGGLHILRWHFNNASIEIKDRLGLDLIRWLEAQPTWARRAGIDHAFVLGKISWDFRRKNKDSWGNNFLEINQMQNPIKLLIERQPWSVNDVGIPHPTHFHPRSNDDIAAWQLKITRSDRKNLISFAGGARPEAVENIRSVLIKQCKSSDGYCRFLDCNSNECEKSMSVIELFMESEFCLQPPGDSPTRKSVFDSLVSGCIPVLFDPFTAYYQYPWHLPKDYRRYSIFVDQDEVREMKVNVVERLKMVSLKEREEMRRYIVYELMPGLVYSNSDSGILKFADAFTISIDNLIDHVSRRIS
ncbi:probable xyloglucan galactosyltransferase GT20 [Magnolia sinica]|uniref:probable xyloglucan galactosyltransferase GT20 n=1 Tax=Magnolia sinica TaxID=86752 RepID=UPI002659594C|nr:probable xyloglucan galactosyltransferase GT20 [Magnolia sinica]